MTPTEILSHHERLLKELAALKADPIGYDDYKSQMKRYQNLLNDHLVLTRELTELVGVALSPPTASTGESKTEGVK